MPAAGSFMEQHSDFGAVEALFTGRTGISVPALRRSVFEAAVKRAMDVAGLDGVAQFCERIAGDDAVLEEVARELAVGETYFFREPKHFDFVRRRLVPDILHRLGPRHVLQAWSAGCSTGEEPYSLAIVFEQEGIAAHSSIIATDLSGNAIECARRGVYRSWSLRGSGAELARPYMREEGARWALDSQIKQRVEFRRMNLVTDAPPCGHELDLIFCRNVLIYFEREAIAVVARKLAASLGDHGVLITGPSDPSLAPFVALESVVVPEGVFYRRKRVLRAAVAAMVTTSAVESVGLSKLQEDVEPGFVSELDRMDSEPPTNDLGIDAAHVAMAAGDYARAVDLTHDPELGVEARLIHISALGNIDTQQAEQTCSVAVAAFPLSVELRYLHANLLVSSGRHTDAEHTLRKALYLDRSSAVCHALLGLLLVRRGALREAGRSFRNAHRICAALAPDALVPLSKGESAAMMVNAMARRIDELDESSKAPP